MLSRIFSLIVSAVMVIAGIPSQAANTLWNGILGALTGIPVSEDSVKDGFIERLKDSDVIPFDSSAGYYKNLLTVFIDENATVLEKYSLFADNSLALIGWFCAADLYVVSCAESELSELEAKSKKLEENEIVLYAGPVTAIKNTVQYTPDDPFASQEESDYWTESDPWGDNWWLEAIDARQAWDYSEYFGKISIGVVDSGFETQHPDLAGKIVFPSKAEERRNIPSSHGTHVAGIIGANHNNGQGIAGVCDNSTLVCVDWSPDDFQLWIPDLHILFGFCQTVKSGAKVINFSLGASSNIPENESEGMKIGMRFEAAIHSAAMSSLLAKGYDFVVVQSAGNGNEFSQPIDSYYNGSFCSINEKTALSISSKVSKQDILDRIIVVAAADNDYHGRYSAAWYSNVGDGVCVAAPGMSVYSTDYADMEYSYKSGTSMAAPVVTGVVALAWSAAPQLSGAQIKKIVCSFENTDSVVNPCSDPTFAQLVYKDLPLVNAKLAVEAALMQGNDMGRICGRINDSYGVASSGRVTLAQGETVREYTVIDDGSFDFIAPCGEYVITVYDGNSEELSSQTITVEKNALYDAGVIVE
ncbi:MAG: S8 family serine peptidase [Clostridia bacterium]|nr:S8 family serine peptidase [Clostridia bacterium]